MVASVSSPSPQKTHTAGRSKKTVEQIYKKMTQIEHILARPDTYVGSLLHNTDKHWVFDFVKKKMIHKDLSIVPGLYKIFDEILVNATDNLVRDPKGMDEIKVEINRENGYVKVYNNGKSLPITMHKTHGCFVPELVFGHLLTSDNYDDNERKITGGRNGYGAKLTNVFSTKFIIKTCDGSKQYEQVFTNNMGKIGTPKIKDLSEKKTKVKSFTEVTFYPDFPKFGTNGFEADQYDLMVRRVIDVAGLTSGQKCKVWLNGDQLNKTICKDFKEYCQLFLSLNEDGSQPPFVYERVNPRWEIMFSLTDHVNNGGNSGQMSFVNGVHTIKGGTHVNLVNDQIVNAILKKVNTKKGGAFELKSAHVKNHLFSWVNSLIENPSFDSQSKETLTLKASQFGSKCDLSDSTLKKIVNSGIVGQVQQFAKFKDDQLLKNKLKTTTGNSLKILGVPKLEDANEAGGKNSKKCTLILTEGDSAKALAVAGLGVIGRDYYGVFPLRGKLMNVRDAKSAQTAANKEIAAILKIIGLDPRKKYDESSSANSINSLRYGSIMIMTDQDLDGSHIKGLLINFIHFFWPNLVLKTNGSPFLQEFVTPIVKVSKGSEKLQFFTMQEYNSWKSNHNDGHGWRIKYYKGLGTNTAAEAKEYFSNLTRHVIKFSPSTDPKNDGDAIDMAFNMKRADERKNWIKAIELGDSDDEHADFSNIVDHSRKRLSFYDFIHKELVHFSRYDLVRSVPSMLDGFKPTQRKVVFAAFKRKLSNDVKVAQFVGYVSEQTCYHHGEQSLETTIINLAQNFVGSNNVNLLVPSGQFGTRIDGGKDSASGRYLYTRLTPITRNIFRPEDDPILSYLSEEGSSIEPKAFEPIIPFLLVNGADGIGTGWSTQIPNFNILSVISNCKLWLNHHMGEDGVKFEEMTPFYEGFEGKLEACGQEYKNSLSNPLCPDEYVTSYDVYGNYRIVDDTTIEITELPLKSWTSSYKEYLQSLLEGATNGDETKKTIIPFKLQDIREYHTENKVHFVLKITIDNMVKLNKYGIEKGLKLKTSLSMTNLVAFNSRSGIYKYDNVYDLIYEFCQHRLPIYQIRKDHEIKQLEIQNAILYNKVKYINLLINDELILRNRQDEDIKADMKRMSLLTLSEIYKKHGRPKDDRKDKEEEGDDTRKKEGYQYLWNMPTISVSKKLSDKLNEEYRENTERIDLLRITPIESIWLKELNELEESIIDFRGKTKTSNTSMSPKRKKIDYGEVNHSKKAKKQSRMPKDKKPKIEDKQSSFIKQNEQLFQSLIKPPEPKMEASNNLNGGASSLLARLKARQAERQTSSSSLANFLTDVTADPTPKKSKSPPKKKTSPKKNQSKKTSKEDSEEEEYESEEDDIDSDEVDLMSDSDY